MNLYCKKYIIFALVAVSLTSSVSMAATGVANSKHNFSIGGGSNVFTAAPSSGETQVCVFCHTPHNAGQTKLLWNKASNAVPNFRMYTSSGTLTSTVKNFSTLPAGSPSLLCLSCHDGKTAMNILHTSTAPGAVNAAAAGAVGYPANSMLIPTANDGAIPFTMPPPLEMFGVKAPGMNIGGGTGVATAGNNLTDDHPIGFDYNAAYTQKLAAGGGLKTLATAKTNGLKFFGAQNRVECSTCHDPHVDAVNTSLAPFLVKSNSGSALCLGCHDK